MSLKNVAEEYFKNINPIANRLCTDLNEVKATYEDLWDSLSECEKKDIYSESIIKPEVCLKYSQVTSPQVENKVTYAKKKHVDNNYTFKDEHSGPFCFRTPSQENLYLTNSATTMGNVVKSSKNGKSLSAEKKKKEGSPKNFAQTEAPLPKTGLEFLDNW